MNITRYRCESIKNLTQDISLLTLYPLEQPLQYQAGQYVLTPIAAGSPLPLSVANAPTPEGLLTFHVRHDNYHPLAQQWLSEMAIGKEILLEGPYGNCTLEQAPTANWLFLAGGTGFAPIKALLESVFFDLPISTPLHLYWGIRQPQDAYALSWLQDMQKKHPLFHFTVILSEPEQFPHWKGPKGLAHEYLAQQHPTLGAFTIFASGPYPMIQAAYTLFTQQGLPAKQILSDMLNS